LYGKHIIAKVDGRPVSDLFPIMRVEFLDVIACEDEANTIMCTIKNTSHESLNNLGIHCKESGNTTPLDKDLEAGEK